MNRFCRICLTLCLTALLLCALLSLRYRSGKWNPLLVGDKF